MRFQNISLEEGYVNWDFKIIWLEDDYVFEISKYLIRRWLCYLNFRKLFDKKKLMLFEISKNILLEESYVIWNFKNILLEEGYVIWDFKISWLEDDYVLRDFKIIWLEDDYVIWDFKLLD